MKRPPSPRSVIAVAAAFAFVLGQGPGMAGATIITACAKNGKGDLRQVSDATQCKNGETPTFWNQEGPQGPSGPAGPSGPQGPAGPAGQGLSRLDDLDGIGCTVGSTEGAVATSVADDGIVEIRCVIETRLLTVGMTGNLEPVRSCGFGFCTDIPKSVNISPGDHPCPAKPFAGCQVPLPEGVLAQLTPSPDVDATWSGCDTVTAENACEVDMSADRDVTLHWDQ